MTSLFATLRRFHGDPCEGGRVVQGSVKREKNRKRKERVFGFFFQAKTPKAAGLNIDYGPRIEARDKT
eukprot:9494765-Pyramimonas_sp.AAC.1